MLYAHAANNLNMGAWGKSPTKSPQGKSGHSSGVKAGAAAVNSLAKQYDKPVRWRLQGNSEQRIETWYQPVSRFVVGFCLSCRVPPRLALNPVSGSFNSNSSIVCTFSTDHQINGNEVKPIIDCQLLHSGNSHLKGPALQTMTLSRPASLCGCN